MCPTLSRLDKRCGVPDTMIRGPDQRPESHGPRWWNSLFVRLAVAINLTTLGVLGVFWLLDHRREYAAHRAVESARLLEEAKVLRVARGRLQAAGEFQEFLDAFCRQMGVTASPGHHIAVFDSDGNLVTRAHERANEGLEAKMAEGRTTEATFDHDGEDYLALRVPAEDGAFIVVAQSMAPVQRIVRAQGLSRAASLGLLAVLIFGVTTIMVLRWVRDPLRDLVSGIRQLGQGRFDVRVRPSGSPELRYLGHGVNEMATALEAVEKDREAQMRRARAIQQRLLPRDGGAEHSFELTAFFEPAESVAGDLYDVVPLPDGSTLLVVLDVSGHGVAAALYTALLRAVLRGQAKTTSDLSLIADAMNEELSSVTGKSGEFATCMLVRVEDDSDALEFVGAGHDPGVIVRADGSVQLLDGEGLPLGIRASEGYATANATLGLGDSLFLYTDGLHEVFDERGIRYGWDRLVELLRSIVHSDADDPLDEAVRVVRAFASGSSFDDDVTLLRVRRSAPHPVPN